MMDINEIRLLLPHKYPFLLIDRIIELDIGKKIIAQKNVTINEYFFQGHFPTLPVMPGVLIIECMAQAGTAAIMQMEEYKGKIAYLGTIDKARFRKKVIPGDVLIIEVEIVKLKKIAGIGKGIAYVDGKKVCEAEFTFIIGN